VYPCPNEFVQAGVAIFYLAAMNLPFFYIETYNSSQQQLTLDEDTSRHIIQVLRMKAGEQLNLTDGKGQLLTCTITDEHKKHCVVTINSKTQIPNSRPIVTIGISLLKNANRFEWFLEKATEIGVSQIVPLICERTEKEKFRHDRLHGILISAMLQSQQVWLPVLHEPIAYELIFRMEEITNTPHRFIAHCIDDTQKRSLIQASGFPFHQSIILIGPEGDFNSKEIEIALQNQFVPVTFGSTRLRTETAGVVAASLLLQ
jgi:16S rRNA (uracil1498-N3)-methyltransferase